MWAIWGLWVLFDSLRFIFAEVANGVGNFPISKYMYELVVIQKRVFGFTPFLLANFRPFICNQVLPVSNLEQNCPCGNYTYIFFLN